jgi:predicted glycosyltransferase
MRVWIDLANSPHPLLFAPVARLLQEAGHEVLLTARDNAQTVELARERWPEVEVIGGPSPKPRAGKAAAIAARVRELRRWARAQDAELALSHNSYAQIVAACSLRLPVVTAMDFEHQPANHLAFRLADTILLPEALRRHPLRTQGVTPRKVRFYPGLKEEIYLGDFEPDRDVLAQFGFARAPDRPVVVLRTPPSRAAYHRFGNPLFARALEVIGRDPAVRCVALTRHPEQLEAIRELALPSCQVPAAAVDSRSLMRAADLVIGAGGTMTREAALLGIPTFSVFAGATPAVDAWLCERGLLHQLSSVEELLPVRCRGSEPRPLEGLRERSETLGGVFLDAVEATAAERGGRCAGLTRYVRSRPGVATEAASAAEHVSTSHGGSQRV